MVLIVKALIILHGVFTHLIWSFEVWLILYFLKNLMHRLPEHSANYMGSSRYCMPSEISPESIVIIPLRPEIPSALGNHFGLNLSLLLVLLDSLILINTIHKLVYTPSQISSQRLP